MYIGQLEIQINTATRVNIININIIKQATTTPPTTKLFKGGNLRFLHSDCSEFRREDQFNTVIKQANTPPSSKMD